MISYLIYIALGVICVAFWRIVVKILVVLAIFLLITGIIVIIQDMHHLR